MPALNDAQDGSNGPIIVKKYANRRLYDTESSSYVTLEHLAQMVREGKDFEVRDARSDEDITRAILAQIIFEEENKGQHLLPVPFLRQLIRFYGDGLQTYLPSYLEMSMQNFIRNQEELRRKFADALSGRFALKDLGAKDLKDMTQKNLRMFEEVMRKFAPSNAHEGASPKAAATGLIDGARDQEIRELKHRLAAMREEIARLAEKD